MMQLYFFFPEEKQHGRNKILDSLSDVSGQTAVSYSGKVFLSSQLCTHRYTQIYVGVCTLICEQPLVTGGFFLLQ